MTHLWSSNVHIRSASQNISTPLIIEFNSPLKTAGVMIHAFLDTLVIPQPDGSLSTTGYRKPTHHDIYMQWDCHHTIASKNSVLNTLHHNTRAVCSNSQLLENKEEHLQGVLIENKYHAWSLNRMKMKINAPTNQDKDKRGTNICASVTSNSQRPYMVVPYAKGLSESLNNVCRKHGVQVHFKGGNTIKRLLMTPRDKDPLTKKNVIIYRYKCDGVECDDEYKGESSSTFGQRVKEHLKAPPQYMTILTSLVIVPPLITSVLWGGPELSKKQYT